MRVTAITAAKMQELIDKLMKSAHLDGDDLILVLNDDSLIDVGNVRGPQGIPGTTGGSAAQEQLLSPTGVIVPYGGATAPTGWLLCDGASYTQSSFSNLYAVIGKKYGGTDPNFKVPNLKASFPMGMTVAGDRGTTGGFTDGQVVSHAHPHDHPIPSGGNHRHNMLGDDGNRIVLTMPDPVNFYITRERNSIAGHPEDLNQGVSARSMDMAGDHAHGGSTDDDATYVGVSATGANLPPYVVTNYIIRHGQ